MADFRVPAQVFLFGDSSTNVHNVVRNLYHIADESVLVRHLLDTCMRAVRDEVSKLPIAAKQLFEHHEFHELSEYYETRKEMNPAVLTVLNSVAGLGCLVR